MIISPAIIEGPELTPELLAALAGYAVPLNMARFWFSSDAADGPTWGDPDPERQYQRLKRDHNGRVNLNGALAWILRPADPDGAKFSPVMLAEGMKAGAFPIAKELSRPMWGVLKRLVEDGLEFTYCYANVAGEAEPPEGVVALYKRLRPLADARYQWQKAIAQTLANCLSAVGIDPHAAVLTNTTSSDVKFGPQYPVQKGVRSVGHSCVYAGTYERPDPADTELVQACAVRNIARLREFLFPVSRAAGVQPVNPVIIVNPGMGETEFAEYLALAALSPLPVIVQVYTKDSPAAAILKHLPALQRWVPKVGS